MISSDLTQSIDLSGIFAGKAVTAAPAPQVVAHAGPRPAPKVDRRLGAVKPTARAKPSPAPAPKPAASGHKGTPAPKGASPKAAPTKAAPVKADGKKAAVETRPRVYHNPLNWGLAGVTFRLPSGKLRAVKTLVLPLYQGRLHFKAKWSEGRQTLSYPYGDMEVVVLREVDGRPDLAIRVTVRQLADWNLADARGETIQPSAGHAQGEVGPFLAEGPEAVQGFDLPFRVKADCQAAFASATLAGEVGQQEGEFLKLTRFPSAIAEVEARPYLLSEALDLVPGVVSMRLAALRELVLKDDAHSKTSRAIAASLDGHHRKAATEVIQRAINERDARHKAHPTKPAKAPARELAHA